jgi:hypothetical protein|tara:strand:+ start:958 stop:1245 length:288 start_codon:yes stop_codon:yes gene_type:complete
MPILGKYNTHNITYEVLLGFDEKRTQIAGRELSTSAIRTHNSALNYVFRLAKTNNYIIEIPSLPFVLNRAAKQNTSGNKECSRHATNQYPLVMVL